MKLRWPNLNEISLILAAAVFFAAAVGFAYYDLVLNGGK